MKNIYLIAVCLCTISLFSCQKEEAESQAKKGTLHIDVGLYLEVNELNSALKSTQQTEDFKVNIYRADGTVAIAYENALEMPASIELETGDYYVEAHSDNDLPAAFNNPFYYGVSENFSIVSNAQQSVVVTCELANTMVSVLYSSNLTSNFTDYSTTVSTQLGSLVFVRDELRIGYFQTSPLDIAVDLSYQKPDGSLVNKTLSGSISDPLPNRHYEIHVDASIDEGMATFQILLDESEVLVEVVDVSDNSTITPIGAIGYGELLITELMYNPSALSDAEGEWVEIYNNSDQVINLQNLVLERDDINRLTIPDPIDLAPGAYFVFARTDQATDASNYYNYGSGILLPNTGAVLSILNEGDLSNPGALIFSLDYGAAGFPDGSGASIGLSPNLLNASDAVKGTSWCISSSIYSTGDMGTPGMLNDNCQ
jgi:hypothetical protein